MWPDGVCRVEQGYYTRTVEFQDINYELCREEDKEVIFGKWSAFLNYFDSTVHFQFTFLNRAGSREDPAESFRLRPAGDGFDDVRREYSEMLRSQVQKGNNGMTRTKYLTFGVKEEGIKTARPRLERLERDILNNFRRMGVRARPLDGKERLEVLYNIFHLEGGPGFSFDWDWLISSGLSVKDYIAPSSFGFREARSCTVGGTHAALSFVRVTAPKLSDRVLTRLLNTEASQAVSFHIWPVEQVQAVKYVKRKLTDLDSRKIEEQKKAVRAGYDMDILPSDLNSYGSAAREMLDELQKQNERMFLTELLVMNTGPDAQALKTAVGQTRDLIQQANCELVPLDWRQEQGLMSCLPLGMDQIGVQRGLTTSSTAVFIPFTTQELLQTGGESLYYGLNALSSNLIMFDRKRLPNPNGLIFGTPGSGKSFSAKREITNVFLVTGDDIIICDPEAEYAALVERLGGQVVRVSAQSGQYINPMDLNMEYGDRKEGESPVAFKAEFLLSFMDIVVERKEGLLPAEKTVIDRCVRQVYREYLRDPRPENMPILEDLYRELKGQREREARELATMLEIYVSGSLNIFNHRTNVDIRNRVVCYDIRDLGEQLKQLGMLVVQDQVWNRVTVNRGNGKSTWYYVDEFHLLLTGELAKWSSKVWKRFRKWGGVPTGITQNVTDLLESPEIGNILNNSDFVYMLNQRGGDRETLAAHLKISPDQLSYVTNSGQGEGLLFCRGVILPFVDRFPKDTELYRVMTTRLEEVAGHGASGR